MTLPVPEKTWIVEPNHRFTPTNTAEISGGVMYRVKNVLKANGYTIKGSSNGLSGGMDGIDRWLTLENASVRGGNTTEAASWVVLTDGNGADVLLCFVSGSDSQVRFLVSPSGAYAAATTHGTHMPPDVDDQIGATTIVSFVDNTVQDNLVNVWVSNDATSFRVLTLAAREHVGSIWGVCEVDPMLQGDVSCEHDITTFVCRVSLLAPGFESSGGLLAAPTSGSRDFQARVTVLGEAMTIDCQVGIENFLGSSNNSSFSGVFCDLQNDYMLSPMALASNHSGGRGVLGRVIDMWISRGRLSTVPGYMLGSRQFLIIGCLALPWDGVTKLIVK